MNKLLLSKHILFIDICKICPKLPLINIIIIYLLSKKYCMLEYNI